MRYFYIIFYLSLFALPVSSQSYKHDFRVDKVTVTVPGQTIIAYIYPVGKEVQADMEKYYYWYSANQVNRTQGGFSGKLLNGPYTVFFMNKNLKEQGEFKNGLQHGGWKSWHENGQLKQIVKWRSGLKTGRFEEYDEQGRTSKTGRYKSGNLQGRVINYPGKDSTEVIVYKNGEPVVRSARKKKNGITASKVKTKVKQLLNGRFKKKEKKINSPDSSKKKDKKKKEKKPKDIPKPQY